MFDPSLPFEREIDKRERECVCLIAVIIVQ